jgi:Fe-S-cluster-containing hydrogenase component 2
LQLGNLLFPSACRHCEDPVCLLCSVNGIVREPNGEIKIVPDACIGCGACASRCPYGNIQMHERGEAASAPASAWSIFSWLPGRGRGDMATSVHDPDDRVAVKCDLCSGYQKYACVHACPVGAVMRVDPVATFGRSDLLVGLEMKLHGPEEAT